MSGKRSFRAVSLVACVAVALLLGSLWLGGQWRRQQRLVEEMLRLQETVSSLRVFGSNPSSGALQEFETRLGGLEPDLLGQAIDSYAQVGAIWRQIAALEDRGSRQQGTLIRERRLVPAVSTAIAELERAIGEYGAELERVRRNGGRAATGLSILSGLLLIGLWPLLRVRTGEDRSQERAPVGPPPAPASVTHRILRSIGNLLIIISPDNRIQAVNEMACETLGYAEEELIGKPLEIVLAQSEEPLFEASFRNLESAYLTKDGRVIPVLISCSLAPGGGIVTSAQDISARKQAETELQDARGRLQELLERLAQAQEEERRAIAHDLHDGLLQYIVAAELQLRTGIDEQGTRTDSILSGLERLRDAVMEGRRLIQNLRPAALEHFGLVEAVRLMLGSLHEECGWVVGFDSNLETELPPAVETCAYRIVQEALNNARKHSGTEEIAVSLRQLGDEVRILVQDWGTGFDPAVQLPGRVGLHSMRERAELLGGWFRLDSGPDRGTRVEAGIPVRIGPPGRVISAAETRGT
ncbi:MAG: PAS domain-containing sensor histidine kinase [Armatimonadetes bacterium]|nr:PAS domain-containing sensor histidine kinase [Armatimonadota bacterium]